MKKVQFRGITYYIGKEIPLGTKMRKGFFFSRYIDSTEDAYYFVRVDTDYLSEPGRLIEYYGEIDSKHMLSFEDSIDAEESFGTKKDDYIVKYYEAHTLKTTLEKL